MYLHCDITNAAPIVRYGHDTNMALCIHTSKLLHPYLSVSEAHNIIGPGIRRDFWFLIIKLVSGVFIYQNKGNFVEIYIINVNKLFSVTFYFMKQFNVFFYPIISQIMGGHHLMACYKLNAIIYSEIICYQELFSILQYLDLKEKKHRVTYKTFLITDHKIIDIQK